MIAAKVMSASLEEPCRCPMLTDGAGLGLVAELVDDLRGRADEREAGLLDLARELCVLGEETISIDSPGRPILRITASQMFIEEMPYPGWIISTPCSSAIRMMSSCARYAATGVRPFPTWYASSA